MVKLRVDLLHQTWPPLADKDLEQVLVRASGETKKKHFLSLIAGRAACPSVDPYLGFVTLKTMNSCCFYVWHPYALKIRPFPAFVFNF